MLIGIKASSFPPPWRISMLLCCVQNVIAGKWNYKLVILDKDKKNGAPLSPNLLNLKSNTMKNTLQR